MGDFRLIPQIYGQGGQGRPSVGAERELQPGPTSDFAKIAQLMQSKSGGKAGATGGGTTGDTTGATYNGSGQPSWNDNPIGMTSARYEPDRGQLV
jgi:hypothetical protein